MKLTEDFVVELLASALKQPTILSICLKHLDYTYFQNKEEKKIWRYIGNYASINQKAPTIGILSQTFESSASTLEVVKHIKEVKVDNDQTNIVDALEEFIKFVRFTRLHDRTAELYNQDKQHEAITLLATDGEKIHKFSLVDEGYDTLIGGYGQWITDREGMSPEDFQKKKVTFGIHQLDDIIGGGPIKGTSTCFLARSGSYKSTALRWIGISNVRDGRKGIHIQLEGKKDETVEAYHAAWTGINLEDLEIGFIPTEKREKIETAYNNLINAGGELFIIAPEKIESYSIDDAYNKIKEICAVHTIEFIIIDYMELLTVKGNFSGDKGERRRREIISNWVANIAVEFNVHVFTAIQANDIRNEKVNDEDFVITRSDISEYKGAIKPFSNFITINQTDDEKVRQIIRLYFDKARKRKDRIIAKIYQSQSNSRFYNARRTLQDFYQVR